MTLINKPLKSQGRKDGKMDKITRLELLTLLLSLQALLESGKLEEAKKVIKEIIKEAKREK